MEYGRYCRDRMREYTVNWCVNRGIADINLSYTKGFAVTAESVSYQRRIAFPGIRFSYIYRRIS